jgi:hypothetical protein
MHITHFISGDDYFEDGTVVDRFSQKEYLIHTQMKSIFPIQSRDFSLINSIESINNVIYICSSSVTDNLIPPKGKIIRAKILVSGWAIEPIKSATSNKLLGVKVTFIHHMDMQGSTPLPPATVRQLTQEIPKCLYRVQSYLRQSGCPPYLRRITGKVVFEDFETQHKTYTLEYIVKYNSNNRANWYTDLRIHPSMFPFGYAIDCSETGLKIEELKSGIRIFAQDKELDGKTVQIQIREKSLTTTDDLLWNEVVRASSKIENNEPMKREQADSKEMVEVGKTDQDLPKNTPKKMHGYVRNDDETEIKVS